MNDNPHREKIEVTLAILDNAPSMLAYWDRDLICKFANLAYRTWFDIDGRLLTGTSLRDLLGAELFALNEPYVYGALRGEAQEFERLVPGPLGVMRPSLAVYMPHVVDGEVVGFIAQVTDVTLLHHARATLDQRVRETSYTNGLLRKAKEDLKLAQRLGEMGSWDWELGENTISWSEQLYRLFGLDETRLPPTFAEHAALYTPQSFGLVEAAVQRARQTGQAYCIEVEYIHRTGRRGWLEARGAAERDATGQVFRLYGTAQEITARRIARESPTLVNRIAELQTGLADERARNLQLEVTVLEARRLGTIGLIASGMAHDFNNILSALAGGMELIRRTSLEDKTVRFVLQGKQAIERASSLTRRLMNLARPAETRCEIVNLAKVLSASQTVLTLAAGALNRLEFDLSLEVEVSVDVHELEVAILNLVINARDAMDEPGTIAVSLQRFADPSIAAVPGDSGWVAICVADTGKGMDADTLRRARQPFFSTKGAERGTGLGLAIVNSFAIAAGGELRLDSTSGQGTEVRIVIPARFVDTPS
ncbi:hypothetical protein BH10PSE17_BH10PSE17_31760 [soil metagenome]